MSFCAIANLRNVQKGCQEGSRRHSTGQGQESELEAIAGGALAEAGELVLGGSPAHQRSARDRPGRENEREKGFPVES